ncbi:Cupin 1 [Dillenia turbinata]|uniref:Cupin 1 n=1 Tax=Dillenia turbinata TaxID=194707 RepID=A0AAN8W7I1_9MAGN
MPSQQHKRYSECQIQRISAQEPNRKVESEAGVSEYWDEKNEQFECAGVAVVRHIIYPNGLFVPGYTNSPRLTFIEKGRGIRGEMIPGCPETYQSSQEAREGRQRFLDQHQKVHRIRQGDLLALPAGVAHWCYNDGEEPLVAVVLLDTSNDANQLDRNHRRFNLAGNPKQDRFETRPRGTEEKLERNVLGGFDTRILAEVFGVSIETARKIQSVDDRRGNIVRVERGLSVVRPPLTREEEERERMRGSQPNGLEETICTSRLRENIEDASRADVYNPQAGRLRSVNSYVLPILDFLKLSAERGTLYNNALMAPHWNLNAHSVIYGLKGQARIQIVNEKGEAVFDSVLRQGQIVIAHQNFAVLKKAVGDQGFEWVAFKTNANAMINTLAGKTSAIRSLPLDVIANMYQTTQEEARRLKYNREEETILLAPTSRSSRPQTAFA